MSFPPFQGYSPLPSEPNTSIDGNVVFLSLQRL